MSPLTIAEPNAPASAPSSTPASSTPARRHEALLPWFAIAVLATTICTFVYLTAVRRVMAAGGDAAALQPAAMLLWLNAIGAPLVVLARGLIIGVSAWAVLTLFGERVTYRRCLLAAWKAEAVLVVWIGVQGLVAIARDARVQSDLVFPLGLDLFWAPHGVALVMISHSVNVFFVAWLAVLWFALRGREEPRPRGTSLASALAAVTAVSLLIQVARFL